ncbi:MAG: helix-turn-helix transcriptional regulator [Alphaproteobacteria bacterium]|nr:helix-turn-helix transcriptional regulator [Alphaproteobacteria bacterium]
MVESIYDAASDGAARVGFHRELTAAMGGDGAMSVEFDLDARVAVGWEVDGYDPDLAERFCRRYLPLDPRVPFFLRSLGGVVPTHRAVDPATFRGSAVFNELLRPHRAEQGAVISAPTIDGRAVFLAILRDGRRGEYEDEDLRLLELLRPHFTRAHRVAAALADLEVRHRAKEALLDRLSAGILLVDGSGTLRYANAAGTALLVEADGLRLARGRVTSAAPWISRRLEGLIAAAHRATVDPSSGGLVEVSRGPNQPSLSVLCVPIGLTGLPASGRATVALIVSDPRQGVYAPAAALRARYGLSGAEARLAEALVEGRSLREIADQGGPAYQTLRQQLKALMRKTDTNRQSDLVRRLMLPSMLIRPPD